MLALPLWDRLRNEEIRRRRTGNNEIRRRTDIDLNNADRKHMNKKHSRG